jgi:hypothetical protein
MSLKEHFRASSGCHHSNCADLGGPLLIFANKACGLETRNVNPEDFLEFAKECLDGICCLSF